MFAVVVHGARRRPPPRLLFRALEAFRRFALTMAMNAEELSRLGTRLFDLMKEFPTGAMAVRAGVALGFELAAMAARRRGLGKFSLELDDSSKLLREAANGLASTR